MFDVVKKLMFGRQLKMEEGNIEVLKQRMIIIPAYTFAYILKDSKNPIETGRFLYDVCKHINSDPNGFTYKVSEEYGIEGPELIRWMADIATMAGWGKIVVDKVDKKEKNAKVHIGDSPIPKLTGRMEHPVDHPIRGYMAGAAEVIFNGLKKRRDKNWVRYDYLETGCKATGSKTCKFILRARNDLKNSSNDKIKKMYEKQIGV